MKTSFDVHREKQIPPFGRNDNADLWASICAAAGAAVWAGMAVLARMGIARVGAIELLFLFAPLVIVPLGMELSRGIAATGALGELARRLQPFGAVLAVVAILLPPGRKAGILALGWLVVVSADGWFGNGGTGTCPVARRGRGRPRHTCDAAHSGCDLHCTDGSGGGWSVAGGVAVGDAADGDSGTDRTADGGALSFCGICYGDDRGCDAAVCRETTRNTGGCSGWC